jgi:hypothetical protein
MTSNLTAKDAELLLLVLTNSGNKLKVSDSFCLCVHRTDKVRRWTGKKVAAARNLANGACAKRRFYQIKEKFPSGPAEVHDGSTEKNRDNASYAPRPHKRKIVDESDSDDQCISDDESEQPSKRLKGAVKPKIIQANVTKETRTERCGRDVLQPFNLLITVTNDGRSVEVNLRRVKDML